MLFVILSSIAFSAFAEDKLLSWNYEGKIPADSVWIFNSKNVPSPIFSGSGEGVISRKVSSNIKTPDGKSCLELSFGKITKQLKIKYPYNYGFVAGDSYKISFYCKASVPGKIHVAVASFKKPFTSLFGTETNVELNSTWRKVELLFSPQKDSFYGDKMSTPELTFGKFASKAKVFLGPVSLSLVSSPYLTKADLKTETPEQQVSIGKDGNFIDASGSPVFLLGPWTSPGSIIFPAMNPMNCSLWPHPAELDWIYQLPNYSNMKRLGFDSIHITQSRFWQRTLSPSHKGYFDVHPMKERNNLFPKHMSYNLAGWAAYAKYLREIKMPIYVEAWSHLPSIVHYQQKHGVQIVDKKAIADWTHASMFAMRCSLCTQEGREVYLKMWRNAAEDIKQNGAKALVYELFNEPKYNDFSPFARAKFTKWLEEKYGNIKTLNKTWRTSYPSFKVVSEFKNFYKIPPAMRVDWCKFMQNLVTGICVDGRKALRQVDPEAKITVQLLGGTYKESRTNFDIYDVSQVVDVINTGTGGFYSIESHNSTSDSTSFADTPNLALALRDVYLCAAVYLSLADGKPLVNDEMYVGNAGQMFTGKSYPAMFSTLWVQAIRGHNAAYLFNWSAGDKTASAEVVKKNPWLLLNTNFFEPSGFKAIADFKNEIKSISDIILPRDNRAKSELAILFSNPTIRYYRSKSDAWTTTAAALTCSHFRFDAVFEEQLKSGRLSKYKVLFVNNVPNIYSGTAGVLNDFVKNGGTLIAGMDALSQDEYGNPIANELLDLKLEDAGGAIGRIDEFGVKAQPFKKIVDAKGWTVIGKMDKQPVIIKKSYGAGTVYYIASRLPDYGLATVYKSILKEQKIKPLLEVLRESGNESAANIEVHKFTKEAGNESLSAWYFMNVGDMPKIVRLKSEEFKNKNVINPFSKKSMIVNGDTISLLLLPQQRCVLVSGESAVINKRFGKFPVMTKEEMLKLKDAALKKLTESKNKIRPGKCLDLTSFCNKGFANPQNYEIDSAWFDNSNKYLLGVPLHINAFDGVNCNVIRFDFNSNKTCMAMASRHLPDGAQKINGIPVNEKLESISFFQGATYAKDGEKAMSYIINYADGSKLEVPVVVGDNIGDWNISKNNIKLQNMVAWKNSKGLGFFHWEWLNPKQDVEISSIDIVSANGETTPIIVGITAHKTNKAKNFCTFDKWVFDGKPVWRNGNTIAKGFTLCSADGTPLPIPKNKIETATLRYSIKALPDKWGRISRFKDQRICLYGKENGKLVNTDRIKGSYYSRKYIRSSGLNDDADSSKWHEVKIPLKMLLPATGGGRLDNIVKIRILRWGGESAQIRDLRIEWDQ